MTGDDADEACMAAVELPSTLPLAASVADAAFLHELLRTRFKIEVRKCAPLKSCMHAAVRNSLDIHVRPDAAELQLSRQSFEELCVSCEAYYSLLCIFAHALYVVLTLSIRLDVCISW